MLALRSGLEAAPLPPESEGWQLIVYSGRNWPTYFGDDFSDFSASPLVYAHYDNVPSTYDFDFAPYGGWAAAAGKQFWDGIDPEILCEVPMDWDWSPAPFWRPPSLVHAPPHAP